MRKLLLVPMLVAAVSCGPSRADRLQAELTTVRGRLARLTETVADLKDTLSDVEDSVDAVRAAVDEFDETDPRAGIDAVDDELSQLEEDIDELGATVDDLDTAMHPDATHASR